MEYTYVNETQMIKSCCLEQPQEPTKTSLHGSATSCSPLPSQVTFLRALGRNLWLNLRKDLMY